MAKKGPRTVTTAISNIASPVTAAAYNATAASAVSSSYSAQVMIDGPVAYWRLGEASGNPQDSAGTNHVTAVGGTPNYSVIGALVGDANKAVTLVKASSEYFSVPDSASFDLGDGPLSIEFWAKRDTVGIWAQVMDKGGLGASSFGLYFYTDNKLHAEQTAVGDWVVSAADTDTTNWHHWVVTKNGSLDRKIYRDGVDVTSGTGTQTLANNSNALFIGAYNTAGSPDAGSYFNGSLDEIAIYDSVLSPTRIAAHFTAAGVTGIFSASASRATTTVTAYNPIASPSNAAGRVIAPDGNDTTGTGSQANPWKTLAKLYATLVAGETGYCRGGPGVYSSLSNCQLQITSPGTVTDPIAVENWPGETPVFSGAGLNLTGTNLILWWRGGSHYHELRGLTFRNWAWGDDRGANGSTLLDWSSTATAMDHFLVENCVIEQQSLGSPTNADHVVYAGDRAQYVTVQDCTIVGQSTGMNSAVLAYHTPNPQHFLVQRNLIRGCAVGININCDDPGTDYKILHNTFATTSYAIHAVAGDSILIRDNVGSNTASIYRPNAAATPNYVQSNNYWSQTLSGTYRLTAGSAAINGALDGSDAGAFDYP